MRTFSIGIIGAGVMGKAIAANLLKKKIVGTKELLLNDKDGKKLAYLKKHLGFVVCADSRELAAKADYVILAVKPQDFSALANELRGKFQPRQTVISIMAGMPLARLQKGLGARRVIRAMPNLAAQIGESMTVWKSGFLLSHQEKNRVASIFGALGQARETRREKEIDMATAVSGSGPAYVYYFIEAVTQAAKELGFSKDTARALVDQTVIGAVRFYQSGKNDAAILRQKVSSKGGTTAAGLAILEKNKFKKIVAKAIKAAYGRARELAK